MDRKPTYEELEQRVSSLEKETIGRKRAEELLKESEEKYRNLLDGAFEAIVWHDEGKIIEANEQYYEMFGYTPEELAGKDAISFTATHESVEFIKEQVSLGNLGPYEVVGMKKGGTEFPMEIRVKEMRYKGKAARMAAIRDVTAQKLTEQGLRDSNELLDGILSASGVGIAYAEDRKIVWANDAMADIFGFTTPEDYLGKDTRVLYASEEEYRRVGALTYKAPPGKVIETDARFRRQKDGTEFFGQIKVNIMDPKDPMKGIIVNVIDISGQKRAEEALRDSEKRYRIVVEDLPAMICRFLPDGSFTFVNSSYGEFYGKKPEELTGRNFFQLIPEEEQKNVRSLFTSLDKNMPTTTYAHQVAATDGAIHWQEWTYRVLFDETGQVGEYQAIGRDITEVKQARQERVKIQKQLQQAQKMEAIGTLAGGIAHDFNNILGAIIGYAGMMEAFDIPKGSPMMAKIKEVLKAANRAKDLVEQILTFSRRTEQERRPIRIDHIVKEALKFLRSSLPTTIEIRQSIPDEELIALADPTQMHQVLMNLCTNAGHAMLETGGRLEVHLSALDLDDQSVQRFPELRPGPHLKLTVSDTGHGMSSEVMERIFDPFFTTKKPGEGTGMGLAVVHGIVKSHDGIIIVESELAKGTVFQVIIPRIKMEAVETGIEADTSMPTGTQRILFVDDEQILVDIGKKILERLGYEVAVETDSRKALEVFRSRPDRFDLVITDQTMPHMTGMELARKIRNIRTEIPVILCTGYSETATPERVEAAGIRELMYKPLNPSGLAQTVLKVLRMKMALPEDSGPDASPQRGTRSLPS
ncbi:MAG: PAS domain S-box protein [Deltaproteobacteria bacterium]|nr:PAS domain S-box protein [Deltaproteobacteria bacterium]